MITTTLRISSGIMSSRLPEIQALLRSGDVDKAIFICTELRIDMTTEDIAKEIGFIQRVDAARKKKAGKEHNAWESLVLFAMGVGWEQEEKFYGPYEWNHPMRRGDILSWGTYLYGGPKEDLELAFDVLVEQGLFFTVHPGVFAEACYYCEYDPDFVLEIPGYEKFAPRWKALQKKLDRKFDHRTWRTTGLCWGGGSQGPSELPLYICVGSSCCRFLAGEPTCQHKLPFNPLILPASK